MFFISYTLKYFCFEITYALFIIMKKCHFLAYDHKVSLLFVLQRGGAISSGTINFTLITFYDYEPRSCEGARTIFRTFISRKRKSTPSVAGLLRHQAREKPPLEISNS